MAENQTGTGKRISQLDNLSSSEFQEKKDNSYFLLMYQNSSQNNNENYKLEVDTLYDNLLDNEISSALSNYPTITSITTTSSDNIIHHYINGYSDEVYGKIENNSSNFVIYDSLGETGIYHRTLNFGDSFDIPANMYFDQFGHFSSGVNLVLTLPNSPYDDLALDNNYKMSSLSNDDLQLQPGDTYDVAFSKLHKALIDDEKVISFALNNLNAKINKIINEFTDKISENYESIVIDQNNPTPITGDKYEVAIKKLQVEIDKVKEEINSIFDADVIQSIVEQISYNYLESQISDILNNKLNDIYSNVQSIQNENNRSQQQYINTIIEEFRRNTNAQLQNWMDSNSRENIPSEDIPSEEIIVIPTGSTSDERLSIIETNQQTLNEKLNVVISILDAKANISELPTHTSELENNSDYVIGSEVRPTINEISGNEEGIEDSRIDQLENRIHELEAIIEQMLNNN